MRLFRPASATVTPVVATATVAATLKVIVNNQVYLANEDIIG